MQELNGETVDARMDAILARAGASSWASVAGQTYRVVSLPKLIELKLASGMSAPHRGKDLVDVQELVHRAALPRDLVDQLDPYVRDKFLELWELAQHPDDEY